MTVDPVLLATGALCLLGLAALIAGASAIRDYLHSDDLEFSDERDRIDAITELNLGRGR